MIETAVLAFLSSLGMLLLFWCLTAWVLLPAETDGFAVIFASEQSSLRQLRELRFLLHSGLMSLPVAVVNCGLEDEEWQVLRKQFEHDSMLWFFSSQDWEEFVEMERIKRVSGT